MFRAVHSRGLSEHSYLRETMMQFAPRYLRVMMVINQLQHCLSTIACLLEVPPELGGRSSYLPSMP
eukprot:COSAG02_NODE_19258_length_892_cov_0.686003_2_plen_65_part_01